MRDFKSRNHEQPRNQLIHFKCFLSSTYLKSLEKKIISLFPIKKKFNRKIKAFNLAIMAGWSNIDYASFRKF